MVRMVPLLTPFFFGWTKICVLKLTELEAGFGLDSIFKIDHLAFEMDSPDPINKD